MISNKNTSISGVVIIISTIVLSFLIFKFCWFILMKLDYSKSWVLQSAAIVFLLFLIYLVFSLKNINLKNYNELLVWFSSYHNFLSFTLLFSAIVVHSKLGLSSIIDDYIHNIKVKRKILFLKNLSLITIYIIVMGTLIKTII